MPTDRPEDPREDVLEAIRQGLADVDAGRTRPIKDFDREFRAKRGLPPRSGVPDSIPRLTDKENLARRQL